MEFLAQKSGVTAEQKADIGQQSSPILAAASFFLCDCFKQYFSIFLLFGFGGETFSFLLMYISNPQKNL